VKAAMEILGLSRSSYYRQVRGMADYSAHRRKVASTQHAEVLREVALKRVEAGHRRVRAYAMAWGKLSQDSAASSRMSCYRVLKSEGLIQPKRIGHDLREAAERRRQMLKAPEKFNEVLQGDFTDYVNRGWREIPHRLCHGVSESVQSGLRGVRYRDGVGFDSGNGTGA
jgi:hypothetical protein